MVYNLSGIDASNHTMDLIQTLNSSSDGWMIGWLLIITWFIIIMVYKNRDIKPVALIASFAVFVLGVITFVMDWITINFMLIPAILMFISILIYMFID
jgi:glucan phosphoethanolaminetransferase (alkaline phosphatase superfamily)